MILAACGSHAAPSAASRTGAAIAAAIAAADHAHAPWRCSAIDLPPLADEALTTGPRHWQLHGNVLRRTDDDAELVIGVIADAGDAAPQTLAALGRLRTALEAVSPDLIITLGGMGATEADLEATLGVLADHASWPVVALPGDLEPMADYNAAIGALRKRGAAVVDGRLARFIELPGATIATIPGAGAAARLSAGDDGCAWSGVVVTKVYADLSTRPGVRIAAMAEAPRGDGDGDGEPHGELALAPTVPIDVILHGPVSATPSPVRDAQRDGRGIHLSPGTSDALPRGEPARPSAGVLVIRGAAWIWRPLVDGSAPPFGGADGQAPTVDGAGPAKP